MKTLTNYFDTWMKVEILSLLFGTPLGDGMEIKMKKVSIIMGIYNCALTLEEAIESIIAQTYQNWELIMCDDGSMDNTYAIAEKYVKQNPQKFILLKNEENQGLNYTLNRCLYYSHGEYIARMDGDDLCDCTRLEKEVEFLDTHQEFALVSTEMIMFDNQGEWGKVPVIEQPTKKDVTKHFPFFCHAACMIRKEVFIEVGGYTVDPKLLRVEDCHLWFKIYAKGYKGANIPEPLYRMRDDRDATSRRKFKNRLNSCYVMCIGFKMIKMPWYKYPYLLKYSVLEIVKGIMPAWLYEYFHKKRFRREN